MKRQSVHCNRNESGMGQPVRALVDRRPRGFTLVELLITLVLTAVLVSIAAPSMRNVMLSASLNNSASALVDAVNLARLNAIKLNANSQFCGNTVVGNGNDVLGKACGTAGGAVYQAPQAAASAGLVRSVPAAMQGAAKIASLQALRFSGSGFAYKPGDVAHAPFNDRVAVLCNAKLGHGNQRIVSMTAGAILAVATSTGVCP